METCQCGRLKGNPCGPLRPNTINVTMPAFVFELFEDMDHSLTRQRRKVHIHLFCCRGTIEEALERILESKQELFKDTVERLACDEESTWAGVLRETGIDDLLPAADN